MKKSIIALALVLGACTSTQVAFDTPTQGTWLRYDIKDNQYGGDRTWTAPVEDGEMVYGDLRHSLFPGCLLHCNRTMHPIDEEAYATLLPLAVGNTAAYTRQRANGTAHWQHQARVTGQRTVNTAFGPREVFVIETDVRGIRGHQSQARIESWWSPELRATVYETNTGSDWVNVMTLVHYGPEHP